MTYERRTKLREGETTKWRVYQVGREARLRPGVAPREREGGVDAGRRPSPPLPPTRESAATPGRPTSATAHLSPLTPASPFSLLLCPTLPLSFFTLPPSRIPLLFFLSTSLSLLAQLPCFAFSLRRVNSQRVGHHPTESRSSPFSRAAVLNVLHSSQREQTRAGPQEAAWAVLPRLPEPSAPGAVPGFRLLLRACGRTLHPRL
ncbi:unnamed protein product, partial [Heterotrigona itama]